MCDETPAAEGASRREVLRGAAGLAALAGLGGVLLDASPAEAAPYAPLLTRTPRIRPRSAWAGSVCPVRGRLYTEAPGNVRFLLVHHTEKPGNGYTATQVPGLLRGMYRFHTGPEKRWPDLAYNFLVDRYGRIWEGRAGSLARPVMPSATGGSQGFSQLACYLGNHSTVAPTPKAEASMISLLAWLANRYALDTRPGATTSFVSRGSSRWPRGTTVRTRTIEGHRAMSVPTTCPGAAAYRQVRESYPRAVTALRT